MTSRARLKSPATEPFVQQPCHVKTNLYIFKGLLGYFLGGSAGDHPQRANKEKNAPMQW